MTKTVLIRDVADKIAMGPFGSNIKVSTFVESGVPIISGQHLKGVTIDDSEGYNFISAEHADKLRNSNVFRGDIVFTHAGNIGQVAYIPKSSKYDKYVLSQRQFYLRPSKDASTEYLTYYFKSPRGQSQLFEFANQTGVPSLSQPATNLKKIKIELPDLETQKRIANILGTIDEKIELNRKMNKTLDQMGQVLFRHYFIDNAKAEEWDRVPISELCEKVGSGGTPATKREDYYGGEVEWYSTKELKDSFLLGSEKTITHDGLSNSAAKLFPENTVMMAIYAAPTVGRLGILTSKASFNQAACGLIAKPEIGYEFIYLYLLLSRVELNNMANGAAQQNISVGKVRDFKVMYPDSEALMDFHREIKPIFVQIRNNSEQIQTLVTLRDSLLPRLITGKILI